MADLEQTDDPDAARLEAALARIARARPPAQAAPAPGNDEAKHRLDALITDLRAVLGRDSPEEPR